MIDKILDKHGGRSTSANDNEGHDESAADDLGSFGFLRGSRERATMLQLRKKDGSILAIAYGYIDKVEFDPTDGITLHFAGETLRVRGRNLNVEVHPKVRLFEAICRHRVPWLREVDEPDIVFAEEGAAVIDAIEW